LKTINGINEKQQYQDRVSLVQQHFLVVPSAINGFERKSQKGLPLK
jgi:hypothetical protein